MLGPAHAAQNQHSSESEDSPALAAELRAARADFAIGKTEQPGNDERQKEQPIENRLDDEHETAGIPVCIEREERTHAVVVGPVEKDVAERGDAGGEIEPAPMNSRVARHPERSLAGFRAKRSRRICGCFSGIPSITALIAFSPLVDQPHRADHDSRNDRHGPESVRDAAMVLELVDRAAESPEYVEVGGLGGQHGRKRGVGRLAVESGAAQACAGKEMSDWLHEFVGLSRPTRPCASAVRQRLMR